MRYHWIGAMLLAGAAGSSLAAQDDAQDDAPAVRFTPIQAADFAEPGSLANAWGDVDGDGDLDLAVAHKSGEIRLYENRAGQFVSVGQQWNLPTSGDEIRGLSWGDYDHDGDLDLIGGSNVSPYPTRSYVWRNDGDGFVEVAEAIGLAIPARWSRQANWVDFDNDGDLDLYAANRTGSNSLWRNDGGRFTQVPASVLSNDPRRTVGACWFDMDGDGDLDLFLTNQNGDSDAMWRNDGASFTDVAGELGMDQTQRLLPDGGVGCAVGDYDNDGDFDLYVAAYGDNLLYRNDGDGRWSEVAAAQGVTGQHSTVGAAFGDYDNDGWLDLILTGYEVVGGVQVPLVKLYRNTGAGFAEQPELAAQVNAGDHGVEWVDYDGDGDLDLSLTDGYGDEGGHPLFRNELGAEARARGIAVTVLDEDGIALVPGAEVRIRDAAGAVLGSRMVSTGGGYNAQSAVPVWWAGKGSDPVTVDVTFMSNSGPQTRRIANVPRGALLRVEGLAGEVSMQLRETVER